MALNKAQIIGNLGSDPKLRHTKSGTAVCNMSVATNRTWKDDNGQKQEESEWHRIVVFGKQAESCEQYLAKGRQVYVEGRLQTREWEDDNGNTKYTTEIVAQNVQFLQGGENGGKSGGGRNRGGGRGRGGRGGGRGDSGGGVNL